MLFCVFVSLKEEEAGVEGSQNVTVQFNKGSLGNVYDVCPDKEKVWNLSGESFWLVDGL